MQNCSIQGRPVPEDLIDPLHDASDELDAPSSLRQKLNDDGYLFLRGVLNRDEVLAAREEVFGRLVEVGEIEPPASDGIATGHSQRLESTDDLGTFWQSVSEGPALRHVTHGPRLREIMELVFGEPARPHDLMYLRASVVGNATPMHYDYPFFAGFSDRIFTAWVPLGDVPVGDGPLVIVEGSNRFSDLLDPIRNANFESDHSNDAVQKAAYEKQNAADPITLVRERATKLLTANFCAGDLMVFTGWTMHGSLDNHSPIGRTRLSCDVRYQPASQSTDDSRYFGPHPTGSKGGGYGDMRGAKPLTEPW